MLCGNVLEIHNVLPRARGIYFLASPDNISKAASPLCADAGRFCDSFVKASLVPREGSFTISQYIFSEICLPTINTSHRLIFDSCISHSRDLES